MRGEERREAYPPGALRVRAAPPETAAPSAFPGGFREATSRPPRSPGAAWRRVETRHAVASSEDRRLGRPARRVGGVARPALFAEAPSSRRTYERPPRPALPLAHARRAPGPSDFVRLLPRRPAPSATPSPLPAPPATAAGLPPDGPRRPRQPAPLRRGDRVAHAPGALPVPRDRPLGRAPGPVARSAGRRVRRRADPRPRPVPPDGAPRPDRPAPRPGARRASEGRAPRPRTL